MDASLEPLSSPLSIVSGYSLKEETCITVRCHDRVFKSVTVVDDAGRTLFTVESKGASSLSWRRTVLDSYGHHIFDLRHFGYAMKNKWAVESPEGEEICSLKHATYLNKERSALDAIVKNVADEGKEVMLEMRPKDHSAITTMVTVHGAPVAEIVNTEANDVISLNGRDRSVWKARVAKGLDLALVGTSHIFIYDNNTKLVD